MSRWIDERFERHEVELTVGSQDDMRDVRQPGANRREHELVEGAQRRVAGLGSGCGMQRGERGVDRGVDRRCVAELDPLRRTLPRHQIGQVAVRLRALLRCAGRNEALIADKFHQHRATR
jgi:hypothetical protein